MVAKILVFLVGIGGRAALHSPIEEVAGTKTEAKDLLKKLDIQVH